MSADKSAPFHQLFYQTGSCGFLQTFLRKAFSPFYQAILEINTFSELFISFFWKNEMNTSEQIFFLNSP